MECTPWEECPKRIYFNSFWFEFISKYHKTAGCNLWQPQGGRFTAKFGIGTRPGNESFSDTLPILHGTRPNRWIAHLCRNVQKEYISVVFVLNSCPNTVKQLDASFGSRRGAISRQNVLSAHHSKIKVSLTRYQVGVGLDPIDEVHTLAGMWKMNEFAFFWNEFVCKYHYTVGCNFWKSQGSRFTAESGIGTPPQTKSAFEPRRNRRGPQPNWWSAHLGRNVQKENISIFFELNSSPNTIEQLNATFGSRRGAILQQNSESAHLPEMKVSLTRYQLCVGPDPIDGVHTLAAKSNKNIFQFFLAWIRVQIP